VIKERVVAYEIKDEVGEGAVDEALQSYYEYKPKVKVKTSDPKYELHVYRSSQNDFTTWIVFQGKPIGAVTFENQHDRHMYIPHAMVAKEFRNQGLAKLVYRWFLKSGKTLITERHSSDAKKLWDSLSREFESGYWIADEERFVTDPPKDLWSSWVYRVLVGKAPGHTVF
jgi:hypothetical protein